MVEGVVVSALAISVGVFVGMGMVVAEGDGNVEVYKGVSWEKVTSIDGEIGFVEMRGVVVNEKFCVVVARFAVL